jgi:ATP-binding protein involved in chromosome partitioning
MSLTKDQLTDALRSLPGSGEGDFVAGGHLLWCSVCDTYASIKVQWPGADDDKCRRIAGAARAAVTARAESLGSRLDSFIVEFVNHAGAVVHTARFGGMNQQSAPQAAPAAQPQGHTPIGGLKPAPQRTPSAAPSSVPSAAPTPQGAAPPLPGVKHIIAVGAGKGGVGKSTVALNLAVGLARRGHAVGLLDGDIYGPSMPTMLGLATLDTVVHQGNLQPFYVHGIKAMTIGKLVDPEKPLIWRGPMAHGAFKQLAEQTAWGELDYLIIDLPPGTGDVSLTMSQLLRLTGAVVVCTPQKVAQDDAVRAAKMFQQLGIDVLGVVENMSYFVGDDGKTYDIFGRGGAEHMAQRLNLPFLGAIPITMSLRTNSDKGDPTSNFTGTDRAGTQFVSALNDVVSNVESQVALAAMRRGSTGPVLSIHE